MNPKLVKLREVRKKKGLRIKDVASIVGVSQSMYGYIETGEKRLSYDMALKLSTLFKMSPDELFYKDFENFFGDIFI